MGEEPGPGPGKLPVRRKELEQGSGWARDETRDVLRLWGQLLPTESTLNKNLK